ncbi:MAG: beta strand repeat-containing protein [Planctomycetaceae bacterium]
MAGAAGLVLVGDSSAADPATLYTQTGTDATWQQLLDSNAIPIGTTSYAGVLGSTINVDNALVEVGPNKGNPIISNLRIHTLGNSSVQRGSFSKWSRWYQEDGTTQVFRLFKDEVNVQNDRANAARIESFNPDVGWAAGDGWFKWQGTYTIIKPVGGAVFQAKNSDNDWAVMINTNGNGDVTLNHRTGTDQVLATNMVGQPFDITVYDNGTNYMVYMDDQYAGYGSFSRPTGSTVFRWGMYVGDSVPARDAMLFVTGAKISSNVTAPPKLSGSLAALPARVIRGAVISGTLSVSNSTPVTSSTGAARLDYAYSSSGLFAGSGTGSDMALGGASTHVRAVTTPTTGLFTGIVTATATSPLTATPTYSQTVSMSVLDPAIGSFASGSTLPSIEIDFGTVSQGTLVPSRSFSIFNRAGSLGTAWTANLDLDGITTGGPGVFSTTLAPFSNLASGSSRGFSVSMLTATAGVFSGTYSLNLSDENAPGATSQGLSLTVRGIVAPGSLSSTWTPTTGGSWVSDANWSAGVPSSTASVATIGPALAAPAAITLDAPIMLNILSYAGTTGTLAAGSGGSLTFGGTSPTAVISTALTISAPVSGGFIKDGAGTLALTGSNGSPGTITVAVGQLEVANAAFAAPGRAYSIAAGAVLSLSGSTSVNFGTTGTTMLSGEGTVRVAPATTVSSPNTTGHGDIVLALGPSATLEVNGVMGAGFAAGRGAIDWTRNRADLALGPGARFNAQTAPSVFVDALLGSGSITKTSTGSTVVTIGVAGGSGTFAGLIVNPSGSISLVKTGTGTQVFAAATAHTGTTTINQGTLLVTHPSALASSPILVRTGGSLALPTNSQVVLSTTSVTVDQATGGSIDIGRGRITVAPGGTTEADLRADLLAGRSGGTWSGTSGILTTGGTAGFSNQPVVGYRVFASGSAIVSWSAFGDVNLDGQVNSTDISLINSGGKFGMEGNAATWWEGDFNYDGVVNSTDITLINASGLYGKGSFLAAASLGSPDGGAAVPMLASVPEPGTWSLALVGLAAATLAGGRRPRGPTRRP